MNSYFKNGWLINFNEGGNNLVVSIGRGIFHIYVELGFKRWLMYLCWRLGRPAPRGQLCYRGWTQSYSLTITNYKIDANSTKIYRGLR